MSIHTYTLYVHISYIGLTDFRNIILHNFIHIINVIVVMVDYLEEKSELNYETKSYEQLFVFMWPITAIRGLEG